MSAPRAVAAVPDTAVPEGDSSQSPPESLSRSQRLVKGVRENSSFYPPEDRATTLRTSFCQLCLLTFLAGATALTLTVLAFYVVFQDARWNDFLLASGTSATLLVLRSLPLFDGASPAAVILLCAGVVYVWSTGRMARLELAHAVSRLSPSRGVAHLVSTPIAYVLHPNVREGTGAAVKAVERDVLNAIVRPITGRHYACGLLIFVILIWLLFALKPPSTLERSAGAGLLAAGLGLSALLIGNTLIQLLQYWVALERLLKLILQHRLGRAFRRVAPFVRDSVEDQVSRSPNDLLRLSSCVTALDDLVRQAESHWLWGPPSPLDTLRDHRQAAIQRRNAALAPLDDGNRASASEREACLGRELVEACRTLVEVLTPFWDGPRDRDLQRVTEASPPSSRAAYWPGRSEPPLSAPGLGAAGGSSKERRPLPAELAWLRSAESFVATVVALILNRHVRQFQYFVYTLTACSLLLLAAVSSYAFEPHRLLLTCIWAVVASVVALGLWVYLEIDRNSLLSRIAGTTPGKLTWNGAFVLRIFTWGVVPLLSVAAVQYPDLANQVFAFIEPWTRALR